MGLETEKWTVKSDSWLQQGAHIRWSWTIDRTNSHQFALELRAVGRYLYPFKIREVTGVRVRNRQSQFFFNSKRRLCIRKCMNLRPLYRFSTTDNPLTWRLRNKWRETNPACHTLNSSHWPHSKYKIVRRKQGAKSAHQCTLFQAHSFDKIILKYMYGPCTTIIVYILCVSRNYWIKKNWRDQLHHKPWSRGPRKYDGAFFLLYCGQIHGKNISQFGQKHKNSDNPLLAFTIQMAKNVTKRLASEKFRVPLLSPRSIASDRN